mmetsp:Transcript_57150/g.125082  ORF Transcript_57150/g.125082 Transcript_57150/m.125082 type:complete len:82 (-) Transcript_57150:146-391(-)
MEATEAPSIIAAQEGSSSAVALAARELRPRYSGMRSLLMTSTISVDGEGRPLGGTMRQQQEEMMMMMMMINFYKKKNKTVI